MPQNIHKTINILESLLDPIEEVISSALSEQERSNIISKQHFRPSQDEAIGSWFARTLSIREELLQIIYLGSENAGGDFKSINSTQQWRWLLLAYIAACGLTRIDRFLISKFARNKLIKRKLNQPFLEYRIPPKQYTELFRHFTDPLFVLQLYRAMKFIDANNNTIIILKNDEVIGSLVEQLDVFQAWLDPSRLNYLKRIWFYFRHAWRRRALSAKQKSIFGVMEQLGNAASDLAIHNNKQVSSEVLEKASQLLQPGDVIVTRHKYALTNLFLPGTWPHTALYVGNPQQLHDYQIEVSLDLVPYWQNNETTFEALKDGVQLRTLDSTLAVDYFVILRPTLSKESIKVAIERVLQHRGKRYNFDFDFFRSDRLVCTEVIYRAFDGLENINIELTERAGLQTLAAEDIVDMALSENAFRVIALFGYPQDKPSLHQDENVSTLVANTYESAISKKYQS